MTKLMFADCLRSYLLHPALAHAGSCAAHPPVMEGFFHRWRIGYPMSSVAEALIYPAKRAKMAWRIMRNLLIGLTVFLIAGNVTIFLGFRLMSGTAASRPLPAIPTIENLHSVDGTLWRGSAPARVGYEVLAERGVTTIVDLRAEDIRVDEDLIASLGMDLVRIPIRDGQAPGDEQVAQFLDLMRNNDGLVYLHCGAGVGRTGTMAAAYLVDSGQAGAAEAVRRNLAVGPPSLEQISFALSLDEGAERNPMVTAVSRVLDAPRRMLVRVRDSYGH